MDETKSKSNASAMDDRTPEQRERALNHDAARHIAIECRSLQRKHQRLANAAGMVLVELLERDSLTADEKQIGDALVRFLKAHTAAAETQSFRARAADLVAEVTA